VSEDIRRILADQLYSYSIAASAATTGASQFWTCTYHKDMLLIERNNVKKTWAFTMMVNPTNPPVDGYKRTTALEYVQWFLTQKYAATEPNMDEPIKAAGLFHQVVQTLDFVCDLEKKYNSLQKQLFLLSDELTAHHLQYQINIKKETDN